MNLSKELLKVPGKKQRDKIVAYVGNDPERFALLVDIFIEGPYRVTQRASWPLSYCIEKHPGLLGPHWKKIIALLGKADVHDAVKRNTLRMFQFADVPGQHQGRVVNLCLKFLADMKEPVAIRVFAMTVLANITKEVPMLKNELIPLIEDHLPFATAGFLSRGRKLLKQLKQ